MVSASFPEKKAKAEVSLGHILLRVLMVVNYFQISLQEINPDDPNKAIPE
jgi:hypothetical protein